MDKKIIEKLIISEINDFRRISGLPLLNEGGKSDIARGAIRVIDDIFGITSKTVDKLATEVGGDAARLLKKLADPNDTTPIIKIIDDLMVANKTVGRNVYLQLRNHLDTFVDSTGKSLRDKLDEISANSKQMIQDGSTVDEAAEYFENETRRILDDSTADEELISAITKYEKDINRDWFPTPPEPRPTPPEPSNTPDVPTPKSRIERIPSLSELTRKMTDEEADEIYESFSKKSNWKQFKLFLENLLRRVEDLFRKGKILEQETIDLITALNKTSDSVIEDQIIEKIIKNIELLKEINSKTFKFLTSWMTKNLMNSSDRGVRKIYDQMSKEPGWAKIVASEPLWKRFSKGFYYGLTTFGESSKNLRRSWIKIVSKPVTVPLSLLTNISNKGDWKWIYNLSDAEKDAFKKWFRTGSPDEWGAATPAIKELGLAGKIGAGSAQVLRRWLTLKFILGITQTAIASNLKFLNLEETMDTHPILKEYFGMKELKREGAWNWWANVLDKSWNTSYGFAIPSMTVAKALFWDLPEILDASSWEEVQVAAEDGLAIVETEMNNNNIVTSGTTSGTTSTTTTTQSQYTLEGAKLAASEQAKRGLWYNQSENKIYVAGLNDEYGNQVDYPVTLDDGVYMVTVEEGKIKLSEY